MNIYFKQKTLVWILTFSVILNLVLTSGIIFFMIYHETQEKYSVSNIKTTNENPIQYFKEKLDLNENQCQNFKQFRELYMQKGKIIRFEMDSLRKKILEETLKDKPNKIYLQSLADKFGALHSDLKIITANYFISVKKNCSKQQQKKLFEAIDQLQSSENNSKCGLGNGKHRQGCRNKGN